MDLGGYTTAEFGEVSIAGTATLDGTFDVNLVNGFEPAQAGSFTVVTFGARVREFETINGLQVPNGFTLTPVYSDTNLSLLVQTAVEPGWSLTRTVGFTGPAGAHYNPIDGLLYVGRRGQGGQCLPVP